GQLVLGMFGGMPGSNNPVSQTGGWIQLIGGFLIAFGLFTRISAFICSGEMAVAYFMFHVANATTPMAKFFPIANKGELAVFYCWVFFFMVLRRRSLESRRDFLSKISSGNIFGRIANASIDVVIQ